MGVNLKELFERTPIALEDLSGKIIAIDSFNIIFQFLSTIRSRDGTLLRDSHNNVTSHLIGLFGRITNFLQAGIKPVFVFDGKSPELKHKEQEHRHEIKKQAEQLYKTALEKGNIEEMRKYGARTSHLDEQMILDAKKLIQLFGLPVIQAPCEGEAQAAHIVKKGDAWAVGSQDYDSLVCGTPRLIQNLSVTGKRKNPKTLAYKTINPELIELEPNLKKLEITQDQLLMLAMLVGTDYNPGGIKGIGPKNALKIVKQHKNPEELFKSIDWKNKCDIEWQEIWDTFKKMPVINDYKINFTKPDFLSLKKFLVEEHDFGTERVNTVVTNLEKIFVAKKQTSLQGF